MKFCPNCGTPASHDDDEYCSNCGARFDGRARDSQPEDQYPGSTPTYTVASPPKRNKSGVMIAVGALLIAVGIMCMFVLPAAIQPAATYEVTVNVDSICVTVDPAKSPNISWPYETESVEASLDFSYGTSQLQNQRIGICMCKNGEVVTSCGEPLKFNITDKPSNLNFKVFLNVKATHTVSPGNVQYVYDTIDIYDDTANIIGDAPSYVGFSGVKFGINDLDENGKITWKGDSNPIGEVKFTITYKQI